MAHRDQRYGHKLLVTSCMIQFLMLLVAVICSGAYCHAQVEDVVISKTGGETFMVRLRAIAGEYVHHDATFLRLRKTKSGIDTLATAIDDINGRNEWVDVLGLGPDSASVVLALTDAIERVKQTTVRRRLLVVRPSGDGRYVRDFVDDAQLQALQDIVQGARIVHKGLTKDPIAGLQPINTKEQPYSRSLGRAAYHLANIERIEPMWLLAQNGDEATTVLNYGFDDQRRPTVQVIRMTYGPMRRVLFQHGTIVGVTPNASDPPTLRIFDESSDSSSYARSTVHQWEGPRVDTVVDGRYRVTSMTFLSSCTIPPRTWLPFPRTATVVREIRMGFAPGYEGCASARLASTSWPFGKPLAQAMSCQVVASATDAEGQTWYFVSARVNNDPAVRRSFNDHGTTEQEMVYTGGWVPASALKITGVPALAASAP